MGGGRRDPDVGAGLFGLHRRDRAVSGPEVVTLGCRLNMAESEAMRQLAGAAEDLVIVNSCAVTNEAVRQTRQAIRRAKRARPDARVVVTGCAAQVDPESFAAMPEVSRVLGNLDKLDAESFTPASPEPVEGRFAEPGTRASTGSALAALLFTEPSDPAPAEIRVSDIMAVRANAPHLAASYAERSRAFVEVQNGCDHRCTFCIIPYGRGNSRSVPAGLVVDRIKALVDQGLQEVVLTGVDVTSYGPDLPGAPTLGLLVERILRHVPTLPRLRLSSLDCIELDDRLFELATGEPRFMPHLHMSFQAGDDMVLKRMKRRHSRAQAVETVARLREHRPEIAIGADLIAGFPTETEAMHENSMALIDECDIVMGHIFPYSPKAGTPAARMPQVAADVVKERARRLREASARRRAMWLASMVGTRQKVLMERGGSGHAENFAPVRLEARPDEVGKVVEAVITRVERDILVGAPL
jgi:threonylcarbamoyladenosine tRNA methylthiotransferase MtaB